MFSTRVVDDDVLVIKLETLLSKWASYSTHVPLVDGLLIDTGFAKAASSLVKALAGREVSQIANTHAHEDHIGNNSLMVRLFNAVLLSPEAARVKLQKPEAVCTHPYQYLLWGLPEPSQATALGPEIQTSRFKFQVIPTPGHSADHVCLYEPERGWLFGGDLFLSVKVRLARGFENANDLRNSLRRVCALKPRMLFCYHRGVITDPLSRLQKKLEFMDDLHDRIHELAASGTSIGEIARRVLGPDPLSYKFITQGDFSKANLVQSFLKDTGAGYET
jgi:glyoxylase-like metal-dependent hydrolase (beta-lactamase superfamily II)